MKRVFTLALSVLLLVVWCFAIPIDRAAIAANDARQAKMYYPDYYEGYNYSCLPETSKWPYGNHQKMIDACQIPKEVYASLTTDELAHTIMAYPLLYDMFAYDDFEVGFDAICEQLDALKEFCNRKDRTTSLIKLVAKLDVTTKTMYSDAVRAINDISVSKINESVFRGVFDLVSLTTVLSQGVFQETITQSDIELLNSAIAERIKYGDVSVFVEGKCDLTDRVLSDLYDNCENKAPIAQPVFSRYEAVSFGTKYVKLPNGKSVTAHINKPVPVYIVGEIEVLDYDGTENDFPFWYKLQINNKYKSIYGLDPISDPTVKYNCHSYAWCKQSPGEHWIDNNQVSTACLGYNTIAFGNLEANDRGVYYNGNSAIHSYYIDNVAYPPGEYGPPNIFVCAKWGRAGLYRHRLGNDPYSGSHTYYRKGW